MIIKDNADNPYAIKDDSMLVHTVDYLGPKARVVSVPLAKFIKDHLNLLPCFTNLVFKPNNVGLGERELNTWAGFNAKLVTKVDMDKVEPWLNHVRDVWADGDELIYRYIMSWIKQVATHPERPSGVALAIRGEQSTGKTMVADLFSRQCLW